MVYKKIANTKGNYKDVENVRFDLFEAHEAWTPQGKNVGWDVFFNKDAACAAYGLTYDPLDGDNV